MSAVHDAAPGISAHAAAALRKAAPKPSRCSSFTVATYPLEQQLVKLYLRAAHTRAVLNQAGVTDPCIAVLAALAEWLGFDAAMEPVLRRHLATASLTARARDVPHLKEAWWRAAGRQLLRDANALPGAVFDAVVAAAQLPMLRPTPAVRCLSITTATFDLSCLPWPLPPHAIFPHLQQRDLAAMRLVNRAWCEAVTATVTALHFCEPAVPRSFRVWRWPCVQHVGFQRGVGELRALPPAREFADIQALQLPLPPVASERVWTCLCRMLRALPALQRLQLELWEHDATSPRLQQLAAALRMAATPPCPPTRGGGAIGRRQRASCVQLMLTLKSRGVAALPPLPDLACLAGGLVGLDRGSVFSVNWQYDAGAVQLAPRLSALTGLRLHNCLFLSADGLACVSALPPTLLSLDLGRAKGCSTARAPSFAPALSSVLSTQTALTALDLSGYGLSYAYPPTAPAPDSATEPAPPAWAPVLHALAGLRALRRLSLGHARGSLGNYWRGVNHAQLVALAACLTQLRGLEALLLDEAPVTAALLDAVTQLTGLTRLSWARGELEPPLACVPRRVCAALATLPRLMWLDIGSGGCSGVCGAEPWALHSSGAVAGVLQLLTARRLQELWLPDDIKAGPHFKFPAGKVPYASSRPLSFMLARALAAQPHLMERPLHQGGRPVAEALQAAVADLHCEYWKAIYG